MTLVFIPPTAYVRPMTGSRFVKHPGHSLWRHYRPNPAGTNVWLLPGGVVTTVEPEPSDEVVRTFHGGHLHEVTETEAALLRAAGFTVSGEPDVIEPDPEPMPVLGVGSASGTAFYVGSATGARMSTGTASGISAYSGAATGTALPQDWTPDFAETGAGQTAGVEVGAPWVQSADSTSRYRWQGAGGGIYFDNIDGTTGNLRRPTVSEDMRVTAYVRAVTQNTIAGPTARHGTADKYLGAELVWTATESKVVLYARNGALGAGETEFVNVTGLTFVDQQVYKVTLTAVGNNLTIYLDDVQIGTYLLAGTNATTWGVGAGGGAGIVNFRGATLFPQVTAETWTGAAAETSWVAEWTDSATGSGAFTDPPYTGPFGQNYAYASGVMYPEGGAVASRYRAVANVDHRVTALVRMDGPASGRNTIAGVSVRNSSHTQRLSMYAHLTGTDNKVELVSLDGTTETVLDTATATFVDQAGDGLWYSLALQAVGNEIVGYVNDVEMLRHTLTGGEITLWGTGSGVGLVNKSGYTNNDDLVGLVPA